jgi:hypothetical protein
MAICGANPASLCACSSGDGPTETAAGPLGWWFWCPAEAPVKERRSSICSREKLHVRWIGDKCLGIPQPAVSQRRHAAARKRETDPNADMRRATCALDSSTGHSAPSVAAGPWAGGHAHEPMLLAEGRSRSTRFTALIFPCSQCHDPHKTFRTPNVTNATKCQQHANQKGRGAPSMGCGGLKTPRGRAAAGCASP